MIDDYILEQRVAGYTTGENSAKSKSLQFRERNNTGTGLNSRDGVFARIEGVDHSSSEEDEVDDNMKAIKVLIARGKNKLPFLRDDDN